MSLWEFMKISLLFIFICYSPGIFCLVVAGALTALGCILEGTWKAISNLNRRSWQPATGPTQGGNS